LTIVTGMRREAQMMDLFHEEPAKLPPPRSCAQGGERERGREETRKAFVANAGGGTEDTG